MALLISSSSVREHRGWILTMGSLHIVLGVLAIAFSAFSSLVGVSVLGAFLIIAGISELILSFRMGKNQGFLSHLLMGTLSVVVGGVILFDPLRNAVMLTLFIGVLFAVTGLFRLVGSLVHRDDHWTRTAVSGFFSLLLGALIVATWPASSLWAIGTLVGCQLLIAGITLVSIGMQGREVRLDRPAGGLA